MNFIAISMILSPYQQGGSQNLGPEQSQAFLPRFSDVPGVLHRKLYIRSRKEQ